MRHNAFAPSRPAMVLAISTASIRAIPAARLAIKHTGYPTCRCCSQFKRDEGTIFAIEVPGQPHILLTTSTAGEGP